MSVEDVRRTGTPGFAERIWPVIDVHRRLRRLIEAEERARRSLVGGHPGAAIA
jgi:hypothetical protein